MKEGHEIYQYRISLIGTRPLVWRRIQIASSCSFWDLHCAITDAMGWPVSDHHHIFWLDTEEGMDESTGVGRPTKPERFSSEADCVSFHGPMHAVAQLHCSTD
ncbi:MAG: plasmid pRiA4b ORF-3 family protein [Lentisphaerae bacterium]|nr:plasmid pRiA4b ORF-3 family protein [Lentisphaerota bacterium]